MAEQVCKFCEQDIFMGPDGGWWTKHGDKCPERSSKFSPLHHEPAEPSPEPEAAPTQAPPLEPPGPKSPPLVCRKCGGSFYDPVFGGSCKCPKPVTEPQQASAEPDGWNHIIRYKDYADVQAQLAALKQSLGQCVEAIKGLSAIVKSLDVYRRYDVSLSNAEEILAAAAKLLEAR